MSVYFKPGKRIVAEEHYSKDSLGPSLVDCLDDEATWKEDGPFLPCQCAGSASNKIYNATLNELRSDIRQTGSTNGGTRNGTISDDALSALLSRAVRLEPFVRWDAYSHFDIQRFESSKYAIITITYHQRTDVYGSFQRVFVRRLSDDVWIQVFYQSSGRYGFNTTSIHGFHDEDTVDLEMCFEE